MNTEHFASFYQMVQEDIVTHDPTFSQSIDALFQRFGQLLITRNPSISVTEAIPFDVETLYKSLREGDDTTNIFLYRPLHKSAGCPHEIPTKFSVFQETSENLYYNYEKTLESLQYQTFDERDVLRCKSIIEKYNKIVCWSNTSIVLDYVLGLYPANHDITLYTFGSPILVPSRPKITMLNIYHEDDWIIGFLNAYYKFDFSLLKTDTILKITINSMLECNIVILSRFEASYTPHRCVFHFLHERRPPCITGDATP